jgi:hypothetical protein
MRVQFTRPVASPGLSAHAGQVLDLPDEQALKRIEAGHCTPLDQPKTGLLDRIRGRKPKATPDGAPGPGDKPLDRMTIEQLKAYADEQDISLPDKGVKADLIAAIEAALDGRE